MKLKYNLIAWSLLGFFAAACDPMDDIYNEIDAEGTTNTQTMAEYVLTDADYETISSAAAKAATSDAEKALANAVKTDKALNEFASAEKYVPSIIAAPSRVWVCLKNTRSTTCSRSFPFSIRSVCSMERWTAIRSFNEVPWQYRPSSAG